MTIRSQRLMNGDVGEKDHQPQHDCRREGGEKERADEHERVSAACLRAGQCFTRGHIADSSVDSRDLVCEAARGRVKICISVLRPLRNSMHNREVVVVLGRMLVAIHIKLGLDQCLLHALFGDGLAACVNNFAMRKIAVWTQPITAVANEEWWRDRAPMTGSLSSGVKWPTFVTPLQTGPIRPAVSAMGLLAHCRGLAAGGMRKADNGADQQKQHDELDVFDHRAVIEVSPYFCCGSGSSGVCNVCGGA